MFWKWSRRLFELFGMRFQACPNCGFLKGYDPDQKMGEKMGPGGRCYRCKTTLEDL